MIRFIFNWVLFLPITLFESFDNFFIKTVAAILQVLWTIIILIPFILLLMGACLWKICWDF